MGYGLTDYHQRPAFSNNIVCVGQYFFWCSLGLLIVYVACFRMALNFAMVHTVCFGSYYCLNYFVIMYDYMYSAKSIDTTYFLMLILMLCSRS